MSRVDRLTRKRTRRGALLMLVAAVLAVGIPKAIAAVSQVTQLTVCVRADGSSYRLNPYEGDCPGGTQEVKWKVEPAGATTTTTRAITTTSGAATTTTTRPPTTTTTAPSGSVVPTGGACPSSTSSSTYEGQRLTVDQAIQALYLGGFRTMADLRMFVGIGRAESSLCVRVWHWHPEFGAGQADVGWLQISTHFWPAYPQSQTLDPVGAARAARDIIVNHGGSYSTWDTAGSAAGQQATVAQVCAVVPSTVGC